MVRIAKSAFFGAGDGYIRAVGQRVLVDQQHAVLHAEHVPLAYVGQRHIHGEILVRQRLLIHDDGHIIKQHRRGQRFDHFAGVLRGGREIRVAMAQLLRGGQVFVAPRAGFRLIPKLLHRVGAQQARVDVRRVCEHEGICDLGDPLIA